jgi:hypothetical protein
MYSLEIHAVSIKAGAITSIDVLLIGLGSMALPTDSKFEQNLLNPDRWGHGTGLGEFTPEDLCGPNKASLQWGARRVFLLRKMKIEVNVSHMAFTPEFDGFTRALIEARVSPGTSNRDRPADIRYKKPKPCN